MSHDKSNKDVLKSFDTRIFSTGGDLYNGVALRTFDTGKYSIKSIVIDDFTNFGIKPRIAQENAIIYEAHVRGITKDKSTSFFINNF